MGVGEGGGGTGGVEGDELGGLGMGGWAARGSLEGSGEVSVEALLRGEYGSLDGWVLRGKAGLEGKGFLVAEQGVEVRKSGDEVEVRVVGGKGLTAVARYGLGTKELSGEVGLEVYRPSGDVEGPGGVGK